MKITLSTVLKVLFLALVVSLISLCLISCDIQKSAAKTKSDTTIKDEFTNKSFRKGDSVSYRPSGIKFRDTTIYRVTKNNTRLETVYDSNGNIRDINCYASQIEELTTRNMQLEQSLKDKASNKTESTNFDWLIYLVIAIVILGIVALFFLFKTVNNHGELIKKVAEKL